MTSNILASIYATTISYEKYITIDCQNIELSGNVILKDGLNINNGPINTNSVVPNITNSASLGSTSKIWSNAYISDVSARNIELNGNIVPLNANSSRLGSALKPWSNAYINDVSATNIELSGNIIPLNANRSALGSALKPWSNAYIRDVSISNIELSGNIIPLNANKSSLGSGLKPWSNAYISDISASTIELSGNIVPLNANKSSLGSALKLWSNAYISDVSVTNIELSGNMVPLNANSSSLGSALKLWSNAYINDISVTNIDVSGTLNPLNPNSSRLGSALKPWSNAYISDVSVTNIDVIGNLNVVGATKLFNSLEISSNVTFGGSTLYVPASFTIDPIGHDVNTGTLFINGNLIVQGETTTINSSVVDISDKMIVLASNASNSLQADGAGFEISGAKVNFLYNNSSATFNSSIGISISGNVVPLANGSIGQASKVWNNAYIRDVSVTNIELSGNIVPLNANSSRLGSALKPWSNAYINDVSTTNIELSGNIVPLNANSSRLGSALKPWSNAYISDVSVTNIELSGNMVPLNANSSRLGSALKLWSNAYISDVSITNIELSGNIVPLNANSSRLGSALKPFSNAYISDVSITNIELSGNIVPLNANSSRLGSALKTWSNAYISDVSATNIELSGNIVPLNANRSNLGSALKQWSNAYMRDISATNIELSGNIVPLITNKSNLGSALKPWSNAYISDISVSNIEVSGNIVPLRDISSNLGSSLKRWNNMFAVDLSVNTINGQAYSAGGGSVNISSVSSNIVPSSNNTYSLGDVSINWSNAYIRDLKVTNRVEEMNLEYIPRITFNPSQGQILGEPFTLSGTTYSNTDGNGYGSALNSDGTIFAISSASTPSLGCVRVYKFNGTSWQLMGPIIYGTSTNYIYVYYNLGLLISYDGRTVATIVAGSTTTFAIYKYNDVSWNRIGLLTNNRAAIYEANSLSGDGNTFAIANSIANNNLGTVFVWKYINNVWTSIASITDTSYGVAFPSAIALSYNGNTLVVSNRNYPSGANQQGIAAILKYNDISWQQLGLSIIGPTPVQEFGLTQSSISSDGLTVLIGGYKEGRVFKYNAIDVSWQYLGAIPGQAQANHYGQFVGRMSSDGTIVATWYSDKAFIWKYRLGSWVKIVESSDGTGFNGQALSADGTVYATCHTTPTYIKIHKLTIIGNYYGLTKDAYPSLNPLSSGVKAVQTWTSRPVPVGNQWFAICWSPQRALFVSLAYDGTATNRIMTSPDGINWTSGTSLGTDIWRGICWAAELGIFVGVAQQGTNRIMTSLDGITWNARAVATGLVGLPLSVCWSRELGILVIVCYGGNVMTSRDGTNWISQTVPINAGWYSVCWSPELSLFVAVAADNGSNTVMSSSNGVNWTMQAPAQANPWNGVCWSPELGIFVAVATSGNNRVMTSRNGKDWTLGITLTAQLLSWRDVCWSPELKLFVAVSYSGTNPIMTSPDGINWTTRTSVSNGWWSICWSPELGIFAACGTGGANRILTSTLRGRPPTSTNVFGSSFNSIDETGKWTFKNIATTTLTVYATNYPSDDRLKHNEVVIANGLEIMERLNPKFYQKTQVLLDASYNGDLSGHTWNYEAGLIAQEVLQVPDLSFAVSGGDYYMESYNYYDTSANTISANDLSANTISNNDGSLTYYNRNNNYEVSYNLITQAYALNYNNIFVYGLAAIKELHAKVKAQDATILEQQIIINSLSARMEALETGQSPVTGFVSGVVPNNN